MNQPMTLSKVKCFLERSNQQRKDAHFFEVFMSKEKEEIIKYGFEKIMNYCRFKEKGAFLQDFNKTLFPKNRFKGGTGSFRTVHENLFAILHPEFEQQVVFGTGKGGQKRFGCKKYTADFFDRNSNIVIEIDGGTHSTKLRILKDELRELFFLSIGIGVVRYPNKYIEKLAVSALQNTLNNVGADEFMRIISTFEAQTKR